MMYKKILLAICIITCILFSVSSVVAGDVGDTIVSSDDTVDIIGETNEDIVESLQNDDIIAAGENTFTALQQKINGAEGNLVLDRDYVYDEGFDKNGIVISKAITIDGNNHVIDAKSKSRIFFTEGSSTILPDYTVVLKNIKFKNGYAPVAGGAIYTFWGSNFNIVSCDFINCTGMSGWGTAVQISGATCNMNSCNFINCTDGAFSIGGIRSQNSIISSCNFINIQSLGKGAAIHVLQHNNLTIQSCNFKDCSADSDGGAIYIGDSKTCKIFSCDFSDCYSKGFGGAICIDNYGIEDCIISSCDFINCYYKENITSKEAIYSLYSDTVTVEGCTYKDVPKPAPTVPVKIVASDLSMLYTAGSAFKVTVYGTDGKVSAQTPVVIKVNGKQVTTTKTNDNGIATYKPTQTPGTYKISTTALGKTVTKTLTVKHLVTLKAVTVKKSAKSLVLQATLAKVNGKYLKGKQVTFKFNGKTYKAKTDSKGVAKYTLKSNVLKNLKVGKKVTYQATYLKDTVKKTVTVKK